MHQGNGLGAHRCQPCCPAALLARALDRSVQASLSLNTGRRTCPSELVIARHVTATGLRHSWRSCTGTPFWDTSYAPSVPDECRSQSSDAPQIAMRSFP